jgi:hypothetical protein
MKPYAPRTIKGLRKKLVPGCEVMTVEDFDEWMTEEVLRYQRTKVLTSDLMFGVSRGIRPAVLYVCCQMKLRCWFDDMLNDVLLQFVEKDLFKYDPVKARITHYLSWLGYKRACRRVTFYLSPHQEVPDDFDFPDRQDEAKLFFTEDFLCSNVPNIRWRRDPEICRWLSFFILAGVKRSVVLDALKQTFYHGNTPAAKSVYNYALVTVRIELAERIERYSGGELPVKSDHGVLPSLWGSKYPQTDRDIRGDGISDSYFFTNQTCGSVSK